MLKKINRYKFLIMWAYQIFTVIYTVRRAFRFLRSVRVGFLTTQTVTKLLRSA